MKKIILAAALAALSLASHAEIVAKAPLVEGNVLNLTNSKSNCKDSTYYAFIMAPDNTALGGCWSFVVETGYETVQVMWSDGDLRYYPANRIKTTPAGHAWLESPKPARSTTARSL